MGNLTQLTQFGKYYSEYFDIINRYKNITRHSNFCLYLNINSVNSVYLNDAESNYSKYYNGISYDSYDYTPLHEMSPILNNTESDTTTIGYKFNGQSQITTYTISTPQINDLIIFPYVPNNINEIFKVTDITVPLNARNTGASYFFQLSINYASIDSIDNLNIVNEYVYLIGNDKNINKHDYLLFLNYIKELDHLLLMSKFNNVLELYYHKYNDKIIINLDENYVIYEFLKKYRDYLSLYIKNPFGILNYNNYNSKYYFLEDGELVEIVDMDTLSLINIEFKNVSIIDKILKLKIH